MFAFSYATLSRPFRRRQTFEEKETDWIRQSNLQVGDWVLVAGDWHRVSALKNEIRIGGLASTGRKVNFAEIDKISKQAPKGR